MRLVSVVGEMYNANLCEITYKMPSTLLIVMQLEYDIKKGNLYFLM